MKRFRDESRSGSQFKGASRGETYRHPQNPVGGGHKLTTDDALQYLKEVKETFPDQKEKYDQFFEVMKDFKAQRIGKEGVTGQVKELFKGHNNLIYGFNAFLPKNYEITMDDDGPPPKKAVEFSIAMSFINTVKKRFKNDNQVYRSFLDTLALYRKEHKSVHEVYDNMSQPFEDQPDLVDGFSRSLPDNSRARYTFPRSDERSSMPSSRKMQMDKHWCRDRVSTSHTTYEISAKQPEMDDGRVPKVIKDQRRRDKENRDRRNRDLDDREHEHDCKRDKKKDERKVEGYGASSVVASSDDIKALKRKHHQEFMFCEKVKERLGISDDYQAFLKCLHRYSTEIITRSELQSLVADLLGKYPDLMEAFNEFLDRCENIDGFLAGVMSKKSIWNDRHFPQSVNADEKDKAPKGELEPAKEKTTKDYDSKSIQELDLSNCEQCTPSYRLLPDGYPVPKVSQRSYIGVQELNDNWVSVTSGSEDYFFKHMRRNQYEESLFRCEDDRFELDMVLEFATSTAKRAEDLLNSINNNIIGEDGHIRIEDYLTPLNLRCIERLYGDHGLDVMDILRENPAVLHVILSRLKKKQEEWNKCRADFNKLWAEIYSKNHNKSLDHRSFYFKQQDSKNLSTKSLLLEIKEMKENMLGEDDMLLAVSSGNKKPLTLHFKYEYPNADIHEDMYKLIKYYCEEVCSSKEQLNKVMNLWITFLEPMLGLISRSYEEERDGSLNANARQPKLVPNGDKIIHAGASKSSKHNNGDTINKHGNFCESDATCREDSSSNVRLNTQHDSGGSDRIPEQLLCSTGEPLNDAEKCHSRSNIEAGSGPQCTVSRPLNSVEDFREPKSNMDPTLSVSGAPDGSATTLVNGDFGHGSMPDQYPEGPSEVEKEEELSPNGDIDKNNSIASEGGDDVPGSESREDHEEEDVEHDELDGKVESEGEAEVHYSGSYGNALSSSEPLLLSVKPLTKYVTSIPQETNRKDSRVFYGNDNFYVLFRLHRILFERILAAKTISASPETKWRNSKDADAYASFMSTLYHLLDGTSDNAKFEDDCLAIFGNQSYVLFTLDKLIHKLVKQLRAVATDEMDNKLIQLYGYEKTRTSGKFFDSVYHENTRVLLREESIYRFEFFSFPTGMCMSIQLMENSNEKLEMVAPSSRKEPQGVLLQRNKRKYAGLDEYSATSKAMEGVQLLNGLEYKSVCKSSKMKYVPHTEYFFSRGNSKRKKFPLDVHIRLDQTRVRRFHRFLDAKTS